MGDFGMSEVHRALLTHNRTFLLRNIFPSEEFWSRLLEKELLTCDMLEDIQSCAKTTTRISSLLDILPRRGPDAFDLFIEALLETSQSHVAERLKQQEVTDQFKSGLQIHCPSEHSLQMFISTFQQSMRKLEHFREQKFEVILEEQGSALEKLEEDCSQAQQETEQLRAALRQCGQLTATVASAVSSGFPRDVVELQDELDNFWSMSTLKHLCGGIHGDMQVIVSYLRGNVDAGSGQKTDCGCQTEGEVGGQLTQSVKKLQSLRRDIDQLMSSAATRDSIPGRLVETELERIAGGVSGLLQDVHHTDRLLRRLQHDTLSELHSCQEVARLHGEHRQLQESLEEQVEHLRQMRRKTKDHPRQVQHLELAIDRKEGELCRTQHDLQCRLKSAGRYRRLLYDLLPNCEEEEEDGDTRWKTREMYTQTPIIPQPQTSSRNPTHASKHTAPAAHTKDHSGHPRTKPQKQTLPVKGRTPATARPVDIHKRLASESRDSDTDETQRSNQDITVEKAEFVSHSKRRPETSEVPRSTRETTVEKVGCVSHFDALVKSSKHQSETNIRPSTHRSRSDLPVPHRSRSDLPHRSQQSSTCLYKLSPPSPQSDQSNCTSARTPHETSEHNDDVVAQTKHKPAVQPEVVKKKQVKSKPIMKQKFKLRNSVSKLEMDNQETIQEENGQEARRRSLTINNLEMFAGLANGPMDKKRQTDRLDSTREASEFSLVGVKL